VLLILTYWVLLLLWVYVFWLFSRVIRWGVPAIFAQASPSRLGERCRVSCWVLVRLGDPVSVLSELSLAQARGARLSGIEKWHEGSERDFSSRRRFVGFERTRVSLRRDDLAWARCNGQVWCFACISAQASWIVFLGERWTRPSDRTWCCCCFKLAQARWASLSEAGGLAWARGP